MVAAGVWRKRPQIPQAIASQRVPTFHEFASAWLQAKLTGVLGDRPIDANAESDYRWRFARHLLPFFGEYRRDEIDSDLCSRSRTPQAHRGGRDSRGDRGGAVLREPNGRRQRPLGPASIKRLIDCLAAIVDEAVEDGHIHCNSARGRRVKVPKAARTFLEMDELGVTDANKDEVLRRIAKDPWYKARFTRAFPGIKAPITWQSIIRAIASFSAPSSPPTRAMTATCRARPSSSPTSNAA